MNKKQAIEKIKELIGQHITNGNLRVIYDGTIGLFDNEVEKGEDFYFIPAVKTEPLTLFHNREEVWKLTKEKIQAHLDDDNAEIFQGHDFVKHIFPLTEAERVYPPPNSVSSPTPEKEGEDKLEELQGQAHEFFQEINNELTTRDRVCIQLRVPRADTEWVNKLIKESYKIRLKYASKLMDE